MHSRKIAKARQSQLISTYGVGSLFPAADESFMIYGIDNWSERAPVVDEPRLARALGVHSFRAPPSGGRSDVPVTRFPLMHYCPSCRRLGRLAELADDPTSTECATCQRELVPSRFVACCDAGHIEDFPYSSWLHQGRHEDGADHRLTLKAQGQSSSLGDILIGCKCGVASRSLAGSFGKEALVGVARCRGRRPWLRSDDDRCDRPLRTLQRGSANVWFPAVRSTISIPPWSQAAAAYVEKHWKLLGPLEGDTLRTVIASSLSSRTGITVDGVLAVIARRRGVMDAAPPTDAELRADEYTALSVGTTATSRGDAFVCEPEEVAVELQDLIAQVCRVSRLREVRALEGFTRVTPFAPGQDRKLAPLSEGDPEWFPAIEVHGEGLFLRLREDVVARWETSTLSTERTALLNRAQDARDAASNRPPSPPVTARFLALHTLAHALVDEVSLYAGYSSASIRERIYAADDQAGVLIYTASSDAAGSLGGLAALAREEQLAPIVIGAFEKARWCSSDPVCAESHGTGVDNLNLAACHACVLLPETSCGHRNVFLDRVSLIGHYDHPGGGLLAELGR